MKDHNNALISLFIRCHLKACGTGIIPVMMVAYLGVFNVIGIKCLCSTISKALLRLLDMGLVNT
jgi:hypothetical protein